MSGLSRTWMWDDRWYNQVADFDAHVQRMLLGGITDILPEAYGHFSGGTQGWVSDGPARKNASNPVSATAMADYITAMHAENIRVHPTFITCRYLGTDNGSSGADYQYALDPNDNGSLLVDPRTSGSGLATGIDFDDYISDLIAEVITKHPTVAGVCLDFIRTGDTANHTEADNDAAIQSIVQKAYDKSHAVKSNIIVSSWGAAWQDTQEPTLKLWGRKMLNWLNLGIMDTIHAAISSEYFTWPPNPGGKTWGGLTTNDVGTIMNKLFIESLRATQTNSRPVLPHVITWENLASPQAIGAGDKWERICDSVRFEPDVSLYTEWVCTDDQLRQYAENRRRHGWIPNYQL